MMQQLQPLLLLSQCPPPRAAAAMDGGRGLLLAHSIKQVVDGGG
jgi:hypothetical protein